jgi:hypothetical protein
MNKKTSLRWFFMPIDQRMAEQDGGSVVYQVDIDVAKMATGSP